MREKLIEILGDLQIAAQSVKDPVRWYEGKGLDCPSKIKESCDLLQGDLDRAVKTLTDLLGE